MASPQLPAPAFPIQASKSRFALPAASFEISSLQRGISFPPETSAPSTPSEETDNLTSPLGPRPDATDVDTPASTLAEETDYSTMPSSTTDTSPPDTDVTLEVTVPPDAFAPSSEEVDDLLDS